VVSSRDDTGSVVLLFLRSFHSPAELRLLASSALIRGFRGTYRKLCQSIISILDSVAPLRRRAHKMALDIPSATPRSDPSFIKSTDLFESSDKLSNLLIILVYEMQLSLQRLVARISNSRLLPGGLTVPRDEKRAPWPGDPFRDQGGDH